ncbi:hypothetical protein ACS77_01730 [Pseudomonas syringae]|uniref:Uncharacterized protein n=1 Tax=Pseudomonas syringae TaxID=317 RepID=A0A0L1MN57_PSESX|nr:hypothetical protein ACS77_01730 [Pseudomonas syringae]
MPQLHGPGQRDLGWCRLKAIGDLLDERILQHFAIGQGHVRGDLNALALGEFDNLAVLQVRVQLDLIGGDVLGTDGGNSLLHQVDREVGHADLPGQAQSFGFEQRPHELFDRHLIFRRWPVDQRQVQVIGLQFIQAFFEAVDQPVFGKVGDPDFAGDEQLFTSNAAGSNGLADLGFVFIDLRGIDDPVTQLKTGAHRIDDHLALQAKRTKTECGDRHQ